MMTTGSCFGGFGSSGLGVERHPSIGQRLDIVALGRVGDDLKGLWITTGVGHSLSHSLDLDGTLRTYRAHHLGLHPLDEPGETDITADVNFTA